MTTEQFLDAKRTQLLEAIVKGGIQDRIYGHDPVTGELRRIVDIYSDHALGGADRATGGGDA